MNTHLLDATPDTDDTLDDMALPVGQTFRDEQPCRSLAITTLGVAPEGATVSITRAAELTPPSTPSGLQADALGPRRAFLRWTGSTDASVIATYHVLATTASGTTEVATTDRTRDVAQGDPSSTVTYTVVAEDACGNLSPPSEGVVFRFPDTTPSINIRSPEDTILPRGKNVRVRATISEGPIERIDLLLDGAVVRTRSYTRPPNMKRINWVVRLAQPSGAHLIQVRAAGPLGTGMVGVRVPAP